MFYPSSSTNKLSFYSKVYNTAEVDATFYAFPSKGLVLGWTRYTPDNFVFSLKLPRLLTHEKRLELSKGVEADLVKFLSLLKPLMIGGKLGPVLIQLPPSYSFQTDFEKLKGFLDMAPEDVKFAVEFRHPSWLREEVWSLLRAKNVANVIVDEPLLPPDTVVLQNWVPKVKEVAARAKVTYGYFNNHFKGFAVENSLRMMEILGTASARQQETKARATRFLDKGVRDEGESSILEFVEKGPSK